MLLGIAEQLWEKHYLHTMAEKKIVYVLGAGASAQSIPLVSQLNFRLRVFQTFLEAFPVANKSEMIKDIKDLIEKEKDHYSIDTYARKLSLQNNSLLLNKLKALLACFFFFEQCSKTEPIKAKIKNIINAISDENNEPDQYEHSTNVKVDKRYDAFFAAILKTNDISISNPTVPSNINIVSWNYDNQFEMSLDEFLSKKGTKDYPLWFMAKPTHLGLDSYEKTMLIRLNGEAINQHKWTSILGNDFLRKGLFNVEISDRDIDIFVGLYEYLVSSSESLLQFAWDTDPEIDNRVKYACKLISEADVVIIIGYSFPYYNLRIDQSIFKKMRGETKIYIQAPEDSLADIKSRLIYIGIPDSNDKIELIESIDLFFLPPEYFGI